MRNVNCCCNGKMQTHYKMLREEKIAYLNVRRGCNA